MEEEKNVTLHCDVSDEEVATAARRRRDEIFRHICGGSTSSEHETPSGDRRDAIFRHIFGVKSPEIKTQQGSSLQPLFSFPRAFPNAHTAGIVFVPGFAYIEATDTYLVRYDQGGKEIPFGENRVVIVLPKSAVSLSRVTYFSTRITLIARFAGENFLSAIDLDTQTSQVEQIRQGTERIQVEPNSTIIGGLESPFSLTFGQICTPFVSFPLKGFGTQNGEDCYPANCRLAEYGYYFITFAEGLLSFWDAGGNREKTVQLECSEEWSESSAMGMTISDSGRLFIPTDQSWFAYDLKKVL